MEEAFFVGMEEGDKEDSDDLATFIGQQESLQSSELLLWYTPLKKCIQAV